MTTPSPVFRQLNQLLSEIAGTTKVAADEPEGNGATGSDTKHPTAKADDGLAPAVEGERAREMSQGVKDLGLASVDAAADADPNRSQEAREADIGMTVSNAGNDPALEDNYKATLKEPGVGTSTEAKFDDGEKYASVGDFLKAAAAEQDDFLGNLGNAILADIAVSVVGANKTAAAAVTAPAAAQTPAEQLIKEAQAGYDLAATLGMSKLSEDQRIELTIGETIQDALADADLVGHWLDKQAADTDDDDDDADDDGDGDGNESPRKEEKSQDSAPPSQGGGAPAAMGGNDAAAADPGVPSEQEVSKALEAIGAPGDPSAGGGMPAPGGAPAPDMGGMPPGDPSMGGMPPGDPGMGGMPPGGDPGMGGMPPGGDPDMGGMPPGDPSMGGVGKEEILQELLMAMQEMGITPEDLAGMANGSGQKMAANVRAFQRSGRFEIKAASTVRQRSVRNHMKEMLREMLPA